MRATPLLILGTLASIACGTQAAREATAPEPVAAPAAPEPPTSQERADEVAPGSELVELSTDDDLMLEASFWPGEAGGRTVVLVHQLGSDRFEWKAVIAGLRAGGAGVLALDMRGHGASTSRADGQSVSWRDFEQEDWSKLPLDVQAAVMHLRDLDEPPGSIVLAGASIGSSAVLLYSVFDPDIAGLALLSPGLSYRGLSTATAAEELGDQAVLLVASEGDETSHEAAEKLVKLIRGDGVETEIYPGDGHGVSIADDAPEVVERVVAFLLSAGS